MVANVEAVEMDMLDLGMVFVFLAEQTAAVGLAELVGDTLTFKRVQKTFRVVFYSD